jgi:hypothetical protein
MSRIKKKDTRSLKPDAQQLIRKLIISNKKRVMTHKVIA